jgi:acetyl esterase/lipase
MTQADHRPVLHVPARDIPIPTSVSAAAQAILAMPRRPAPPYPAAGDIPGWRDYAAAMNAAILPFMQARAAKVAADAEEIAVDGVRVFVVSPHSLNARDRGVFLDIHGGAFIVGGGECCRAEAVCLAGDIGMRVWSVDYRAPPDHPHPIPLEDCLTAYRALLKVRGPHEIVIGGASAGANLTAALILRARDEGLPLPAGAVLHTPGLDMTHAGDSILANRGLDAVLPDDMDSIANIYAGQHDRRHPWLSPVYGDFTGGFPPTFLSAGTRDLFLSDASRMHAKLRAADIAAELHITEAASHGGFHGAPEEDHVNREVRKFLHACLQRGS